MAGAPPHPPERRQGLPVALCLARPADMLPAIIPVILHAPVAPQVAPAVEQHAR